MTVYFTDDEITADSRHELVTFVQRSLLLPKSRVGDTLDGPVCEVEAQTEVMQAFVMGAVRIGSEIENGLCKDVRGLRGGRR
jgi:hypothetical protein